MLSELTPRESVQALAREMESKLRANDHKGGWEHCDLPYLIGLLRAELHELENECFRPRRNPRAIRREAADVANVAMMIADNWGDLRLAKVPV